MRLLKNVTVINTTDNNVEWSENILGAEIESNDNGTTVIVKSNEEMPKEFYMRHNNGSRYRIQGTDDDGAFYRDNFRFTKEQKDHQLNIWYYTFYLQ